MDDMDTKDWCKFWLAVALLVSLTVISAVVIDNSITKNMAARGLCYDMAPNARWQWEKCK